MRTPHAQQHVARYCDRVGGRHPPQRKQPTPRNICRQPAGLHKRASRLDPHTATKASVETPPTGKGTLTTKSPPRR
jgi:hypothetical protein